MDSINVILLLMLKIMKELNHLVVINIFNKLKNMNCIWESTKEKDHFHANIVNGHSNVNKIKWLMRENIEMDIILINVINKYPMMQLLDASSPAKKVSKRLIYMKSINYKFIIYFSNVIFVIKNLNILHLRNLTRKNILIRILLLEIYQIYYSDVLLKFMKIHGEIYILTMMLKI